LQIKLSTNTYPLLLLPPPSPPALSLPTQEAYTQLAFEQLNVPAFSILPAPLAALFALGATTGILLNLGRDRSEITVIIDSVVRYECSTTVMVGQADCESAFERLLMGDEALDKELKIESGLEAGSAWDQGQKEKLVKEICEVIWRECTGEDIEIPAATVASKAFIAAATQPDQEDDTFDVAKK
jgi:actin-related protein 9